MVRRTILLVGLALGASACSGEGETAGSKQDALDQAPTTPVIACEPLLLPGLHTRVFKSTTEPDASTCSPSSGTSHRSNHIDSSTSRRLIHAARSRGLACLAVLRRQSDRVHAHASAVRAGRRRRRGRARRDGARVRAPVRPPLDRSAVARPGARRRSFGRPVRDDAVPGARCQVHSVGEEPRGADGRHEQAALRVFRAGSDCLESGRP